MVQKKYFMHIEGMDLAGKSTVARIIVKKSSLEWQINNNCLSQRNPIQMLIKDLEKEKLYDDEIYGYLHYVALMADLKEFKLVNNVIQDSTLLLRSINYHMNAENYDLVKLFEGLVERHPVPDISVYLTADVEVRRSRFDKLLDEGSRQLTRSDNVLFNNPDKFLKMDHNLMNLSKQYFNSIVVDTSEMTEEETAEYIMGMCDFEQCN